MLLSLSVSYCIAVSLSVNCYLNTASAFVSLLSEGTGKIEVAYLEFNFWLVLNYRKVTVPFQRVGNSLFGSIFSGSNTYFLKY